MNDLQQQTPLLASVVTVADYKAGEQESWDELRLTLEGLASQDFEGAVEHILVEAEDSTLDIPEALRQILPSLRVVRAKGRTSYDLKNAGAAAAKSDFVIMLDADCAPHQQWLSSVMRHRATHPKAAAISGRTLYKTKGLLPNIFALLDRGYVDPGHAGTTKAISNNNGAFARDIILKYPLRNDVGPFGSKPHAERLLAEGRELRFEPGMVAYHGYGGWEMAKEIRKHTGYSMARYRQINPNARWAWLYRTGAFGIPVITCMSIAKSCMKCVQLGSYYNIKWYQMPVAWWVAVRTHFLEIPGLALAMNGGTMDAENAYR
ncbi:MAG: glycosyltransferase family 2 protein [Nitrospirales bacterium]|nr:glycosyltransferase family 2 protein [Nitrospira sp.]MDR4502191.1 glycosyltransferase family 2 protein [Nitrospirales bacterium]